MGKKVLVVDDEQDIVDALEFQLTREGFYVCTAIDGKQALEATQREQPDVIILDLMLPEIDGLEVCHMLRSADATKQIPIIMLTAKTQEADRIVGLELGADDYVAKPFSSRELVARVRAILRRTHVAVMTSELIRVGVAEIDRGKHRLRVDGRLVAMTAKEYGVLTALLDAKGRVLSREQLLEMVWGYDRSMDIQTRTVDLHISQLRRKLGAEGGRLVTVKGAGYRLDLDE